MDILSDKNLSVLHKLASDLVFPEYVSNADVTTAKDAAELPATAFADKYAKEYPIHTKADTWLSLAYFNKEAKQNPLVTERLDQACTFWGISDIEKEQAKVTPVQKEAEALGEIRWTDGKELFHTTAINSREDLEKVAEDMLGNSEKYTYAIRKNVASQILKLAGDMQWPMEYSCINSLQKTAGICCADKQDALKHVTTMRLYYVNKNNDIADRLNKLASVINESKGSYLSPEMFEKTASVMDIIDRTVSMHVFNKQPFELSTRSVTRNDMNNIQKHAVYVGDMPVDIKKLEEKKDAINAYLSDAGIIKTAEEDLFQVLPKLSGSHLRHVLSIL